MLLQIENLDLFIGSTQILRKISLNEKKEEVLFLLGRNGAGKSSIIKSIIGLYPIRAGKIVFQGKDITGFSPRMKVLSGIGYSPDDTKIFSDLTVEENINLATWVRDGEDIKKIFTYEKIFEIFPAIEKFLNRRGLHLSGGEKKMVSIARALALNPALLLLDEAFEGLSPLVVKHFIEALSRIRALGVTILLGESNVRIASQITERAYIIERGEVIFEGHPRQILEDEKLLKLVGR